MLIAIAGQREFARVPKLRRLLGDGHDPRPAFWGMAWLDGIELLRGAVIVFLGPAVSRG